jgi:dTDP-4-dehydrorhamnose 3,5-epimerase
MALRDIEDIEGLILIEPKRFGDHRGFFSETFHAARLAALGFATPFVQDNHSLSAEPGTVRGLHFQTPPFAQAKLVRVARGAILDVAVDLRRGSPTYRDHAAVELSAANWRQLLVPEGFAHGFVTRAPDTEVLYKVTAYYAPEHDRGVLWSDPDLGIDWGIAPEAARLSDKDRAQPRLREIDPPFACQTLRTEVPS